MSPSLLYQYKQTLKLIISFTGLRGKKEVKKIVDVHSDEEEQEEEEDEDEDDTESDADKSGEGDVEEVRYSRWKRFSTVTLRSPFFAPFLSAALDFLMHFNIMCEQHHRNLFNPFLNGVKNVPCKSGLRVNLHWAMWTADYPKRYFLALRSRRPSKRNVSLNWHFNFNRKVRRVLPRVTPSVRGSTGRGRGRRGTQGNRTRRPR